jgi:hypothetical protein
VIVTVVLPGCLKILEKKLEKICDFDCRLTWVLENFSALVARVLAHAVRPDGERLRHAV